MSGITSGVGVFSGINSREIIDQLLQASSRPRTLAQRRVATLQQQSAGYLDLNSRLNTLKSAVTRFRTERVFDAATASSSDDKVVTATAASGTAVGTYRFQVDRLVTTQQSLSRGFIDSKITGLGATKFTVESSQGRLDATTKLGTLNGGNGIVRGKIVVGDSSGAAATVDLTRAENLDEVLTAINQATAGRVTARADGDRLVLTETAGGSGRLTVTDADGSTGVAAALGLNVAGTADAGAETLQGNTINRVGRNTTLRSLNDGLGVQVSRTAGTPSPDFTINARDGTIISIDIGEIYENQTVAATATTPASTTAVRIQTAVADLGGVIDRINTQSAGKVTASINSAGTGLQLTDNTTGTGLFAVAETGSTTSTARDLGILTSTSNATINGDRLISTLNSTLTRNLFGGLGVPGGDFLARTRDGTVSNISLNLSGSVSDIISAVSTQSGGRLSLEYDQTATGLILRDKSVGTGSLTVIGETADALGLSVADSTTGVVQSARLQKKYIGLGTALSSLNGGRGIGTGSIRVTNSYGVERNVNISDDNQTVDDLLRNLNAASDSTRAQINRNGDGIEIVEVPRSTGPGPRKITIADNNGTVARSLNLLGEAPGLNAQNKIDGSFEREITFGAGDTLQQVADKINAGNNTVSAAVINDGTAGRPFRLAITAKSSGEAGRFTFDTGGLDLGLSTLSDGNNARVFFGSSDPAQAVLISSSTNSVSNVVDGLTLNLQAPSSTAATITVSRDVSGIEKSVDGFVDAFNTLIDRIDNQTRFDPATNRRGALLGDSTSQALRIELFQIVTSPPQGVSGRFQRLSQVGVTIGSGGDLQVDRQRLRTAIETDGQAVRDLFAARSQEPLQTQQPVTVDGQAITGVTVAVSNTGRFTSLGVGERFAEAVDRYIKPVDGIITRRAKTITDQVTAQNDFITTFNARIETRRGILERQFLTAESAIGRLQTQSGSLGSIRALSR